MLREDTVVSSFPGFGGDEDETRHGKRQKFVESRTDAAIASIGEMPPAPKGWGQPEMRSPSLRVVAEPPSTVMDEVPPVRQPRRPGAPPQPPQPPRPPAPPQPPRRAAAGKQIVPIPEPCFEPSVVATIPQPPQQQPTAEPMPSALPETATQGKVIVMFSCRGGCGATTLAVNTAAQLARAGKSVCLVDLDLQLGDVFVALDLEPQTSIAALAREASTIDASALKRRLARHDSGVYALTQVGHLDDVDPQLVERMPALISTLASHFDYVVVDGVRDFGDCALAALDMADQVAMVLSQDVASVRRAARAVKLFRRLGYSEKKLRLVLNRTSRKARVGEPEVVRALGLAVSARVRNDFKKATGAMDDGALISEVARGSGLDKDLGKLARTLAGPDSLETTAPTPKRGLFGLFGKGGN